ncbi:MAG: COG4315 family predicted lipoprotein [Candidatus Dormibacteria bacterium]
MLQRGLVVALTVAAGGLAACGGSTAASETPAGATSSSSAAATPAATPAPTPAPAATVSVGNTSLGSVLTTPQGLTVYYFTPEKGSVVACTGGCAATWPPLKATGALTNPSGATGTLATVALGDGTSQVTYNGWPLHTYSADTAPGQTNGQGIGGKWYVVTPTLSANAAAVSTPSGQPGY